jgi:hypothetical protein
MTSALITKIKRTSYGGCLLDPTLVGVYQWNYETSLQNASPAEGCGAASRIST